MAENNNKYIKTYATKDYVDNAISENGFSGDYNDLINKPYYGEKSIETLVDINGDLVVSDYDSVVINEFRLDYSNDLTNMRLLNICPGFDKEQFEHLMNHGAFDYFDDNNVPFVLGRNVRAMTNNKCYLVRDDVYDASSLVFIIVIADNYTFVEGTQMNKGIWMPVGLGDSDEIFGGANDYTIRITNIKSGFKQLDEKYVPDSAYDYNKLKNTPCYEKEESYLEVIECDALSDKIIGDNISDIIAGLEKIQIDSNHLYYKVSDDSILPKGITWDSPISYEIHVTPFYITDDIITGRYAYNSVGNYDLEGQTPGTSEGIIANYNNELFYGIYDKALHVFEDNTTIEFIGGINKTFNKGTYMLIDYEYGDIFFLETISQLKYEFKELDDWFIPDNIARKDEVLSSTDFDVSFSDKTSIPSSKFYNALNNRSDLTQTQQASLSINTNYIYKLRFTTKTGSFIDVPLNKTVDDGSQIKYSGCLYAGENNTLPIIVGMKKTIGYVMGDITFKRPVEEMNTSYLNHIMDSAANIILLEGKPKINISSHTLMEDVEIKKSLSMSRSGNTTIGLNSTALGGYNSAEGSYSFAEGVYTIAKGTSSHAEGIMTIAASPYQHVQGKNNIEDTEGKYAHIVGNGGSKNFLRSNAHTLDWNGNAWFQGNVSVDGVPTNDNDLTTKKYVDDSIAQASLGGGGDVDTTNFALKSELFSKDYNDLTNKPSIPSIEGLASESYVNQQISNIQHPTYDDTDIKNQLANKADKTELHSHTNKTVLDTITNDMMTKWNKALPFEDSYVADCNTWLTNGYTKVSSSATVNHPSQCTGTDKWGILFFVAENAAQGTGTQMYFPIDGTYKGRVFVRSMTNRSPGEWTLLSTFDGDYNSLINKPTIPSVPTNISAFNNDSGYITSIPSEYVTDSELTAKGYLTEHQDISGKADKSELFSKDYNDLTNKPIRYLTDAYGTANAWKVDINSMEAGFDYKIPPDATKAVALAYRYINSDNQTTTKVLIAFTLNTGKIPVIHMYEKVVDSKYVIMIGHEMKIQLDVVDNGDGTKSITVTKTPLTLSTSNGLEYTPTSDYNPATKKYVDDAVAENGFSGDYNDLTNKPVIPSIQGLASESYVNQQISKIQHPTYDDSTIKNQLANKADKSELFSGNYNDLTNKPSIPSIAGLATENFVKNEIAKAQLEIEGDVIVDLQGYATKDDLNLKADKTEVPSIEGLASESYVQQEIAKVNGGSGSGGGDDDVSQEEKEYVEDMMYSALGGLRFIKITKERYEALTNKDPNTIYIVVENEDNLGNSTGEEGVTDIYNLKWTEGVNLSDTGSLVTNESQASYRTSDFIKVNPEYNYRVNTSSSSQFQVFYYDKNKNYIGKSTIRNDKTEFAIYGYEGFAEAPEDVKYFRIRTSNKTSSIEINELGKREDMPVAFQFRNGYTVASNGSVSAASGYMVSGDIKLEPDYDYEIKFNGNKTRVVFFNTDGNKTGNCLPTDSTYYNETTTLTRADIPEAAVSFRMRFATGGEVNMNNINEHLQIVKTPRASKYLVDVLNWEPSQGFDGNGEEIDDISAMRSGYMTITSGYDYMYTLKQGVPFGFQIFYYNSSKAFISCSEIQDDPCGNIKFEIPSGAEYYRLKVSQENSLTFDNVNSNVEIKKIPSVDGMLYSFGVLSDVHVDAGSDGNFYDANHATNDYRKAVKFLEDEGAEFVAYGGDMATGDPGVSEQDYRKVLEILKNSHIPHYMISGNHDYGYFFRALIESRKYYTIERGYDLFIFVNAQDRGVTGGVDREIIDAVRTIIDNNSNKRLFLFFHYFIRNHGSGDGATDVKYYTGDTLGDNYEDYPLSLEWANLIINTPNLIFCHGHSHFRFKCQEVYAQNNYSHVDGECHSVHIPSCAVPREMSADSTSVTNWPAGSEGYMVKVFADRIEFHAVQLSAYRYLTTYNFTIDLPILD